MGNLIPMPVFVKSTGGLFTLTAGAGIYVEADVPEIAGIGQYLADKLNPATGFTLKVRKIEDSPSSGNIYLMLGTDSALGEEGYELTITSSMVTLVAYRPAGLFRGIQTVRQLLPPSIEGSTPQTGPWTLRAGVIRDYPRFSWRGAMLDVARHFFSVEVVKRYIDLIAYYKMNRFHLHLTDDQGWRIMINSWPDLAKIGGSTDVGNGSGGYYTQADYQEIVAYAQSRYIMVIPEIDMPGHTNAALASYPSLNCAGPAPALYTGIEVGFSTLCIGHEITSKFVKDVIAEIVALTPGPYIHIGGDESSATKPEDYVQFIEHIQQIVTSHGKQMIGWEEVAHGKLLPSSIVQYWKTPVVAKALEQQTKVIMSPAGKAYMDMKYNLESPLGLVWAGLVDVETAYRWDPATEMKGISENDILGVEAPLWTETILTLSDLEYMVFPRLLGEAEIGWSPTTGRNWDEYKIRLGNHSPRLTEMGVNFYRAPEIPWL